MLAFVGYPTFHYYSPNNGLACIKQEIERLAGERRSQAAQAGVMGFERGERSLGLHIPSAGPVTPGHPQTSSAVRLAALISFPRRKWRESEEGKNRPPCHGVPFPRGCGRAALMETSHLFRVIEFHDAASSCELADMTD